MKGTVYVCTECSTLDLPHFIGKTLNDALKHSPYHANGSNDRKRLLDAISESYQVEQQKGPSCLLTEEEDDVPNLIVRDEDFDSFGRAESSVFFKNAHQGGEDPIMAAINKMVSRAFYNLDTMNVHPLERKLHVCLTELCEHLSRNDRDKLAVVLDLTNQCAVRQYKEEQEQDYTTPSELQTTNLCTNSNEMDQKYLKNKNAIMQQLPHPEVQQIDNHAYVPIIDSIRCILGTSVFSSNTKISTGRSTTRTSIFQTTNWEEIRKNAKTRLMNNGDGEFYCIWIIEWSDDFEPNNVKKNKGSVWVKTATFGWELIRGDKVISTGTKTVPVAIGNKHDSHECIENRFAQELAKLSGRDEDCGSFYCGQLRKMMRVHAELFVSLQDQPERRGANYLLGGNSKFHARWGYSADLGAIASVLPACDDCRADMERMLSNSASNPFPTPSKCEKCLNWSLEDDASDTVERRAMCWYPAPPNFPKELLKHDPTQTRMVPFKITYDLLRKAVNMAQDQFQKQIWKRTTATSFLKVFCITDPTIAKILDRIQNVVDYEEAEKRYKDDPLTLRQKDYDIIDLFENQPEEFQPFVIPALWTRGVDLAQHIDVIMHLLFLGAVKSSSKLIIKWFAHHSLTPVFLQFAKVLEEFPTLSWLPFAPYMGEKFGGWVSENFLAFARILRWFYSPMRDVIQDKEYAEPDGELATWKKRDCQKWLAARGFMNVKDILEHPKCLADDTLKEQCEHCIISGKETYTKCPVFLLRSSINALTNGEDGPPELLTKRMCSFHDILLLVESLQCMLANIMSPSATAESIARLNLHIKLFLTRLDKVETDLVSRFGPLRNLWEGSKQGESYIGDVKPMIGMGLRKNWNISLTTRVLKREWLGFLVDEVTKGRSGNEESRDDCPGNKFAVYKNAKEVNDLLEGGKALSVVKLDSSRPHEYNVICVGLLKERYFLQKIYCMKFHETISGMHYFHWKLGGNKTVRQTALAGSTPYILLPKRARGDKENQYLYTVSDSQWKDINQSGDAFVDPEIQKIN